MSFALSKSPVIRDEKSTDKIMYELFFILIVVWFVSIAINGLIYGIEFGFKAFLIGFCSLLSTILIDFLIHRKEKELKKIFNKIKLSFSYITAIIFALCLPVGTPIYVVVIGSVFSTLFGKYIFGGFGYNIFNPAVMGRIFVALTFSDKLLVPMQNIEGTYDLTTGGTITGLINWTTSSLPTNYNYYDLLFGGYSSALGESFTLLLLFMAIILILRKIIDYRLTITYLVTISLITLSIGLFMNVDNVLLYVINHLSTGGIMFAAVFMITDPVTSPRSPYGKVLYAIFAGFLTILIRVNSSYPEGVVFSLAIMNMIAPTIDNMIKGRTNKNLEFKYMFIAFSLIWSIAISTTFSMKFTLLSQENSTNEVILDTSTNENQYIIVREDIFYGQVITRITINRNGPYITNLEVLKVDKNSDVGLFGEMVENQFYLDYISIDFPISFEQINEITIDELGCYDNFGNLTTCSLFNEDDVGNPAQTIIMIYKELVYKANKDYVVTGTGFYDSPFIKLIVTIDKDNELVENVKIIDINSHEALNKNGEFANTYLNFETPISFSIFDSFDYDDNYCDNDGQYGESCQNVIQEDIKTGSTVTNLSLILLIKDAISQARGEN